nr:MAG TPA: hypothetical protein [Caudoviricetes sp.]
MSSPLTSNFQHAKFLSGICRRGIFLFSIKLFQTRNFNHFSNAF